MRFAQFGLCAALLALPATAQGIKFDKIEPGTQFYYEDSVFGVRWTEVYRGAKNGEHFVDLFWHPRGTRPAERFKIYRYDAQGRLIEIRATSSKTWVKFEPFHCEYSTEKRCTHKHIVMDADTRKRKWKSTKVFELRRRGKKVNYVENADTNRLKYWIRYTDLNIVEQKREKVINETVVTTLTKIVAP